MKRFVDLKKGMDEVYGFAWFDTVVDQFETHSGSMEWDTFEEFAEDYVGTELERYINLTPDWAWKDTSKTLVGKLHR